MPGARERLLGAYGFGPADLLFEEPPPPTPLMEADLPPEVPYEEPSARKRLLLQYGVSPQEADNFLSQVSPPTTALPTPAAIPGAVGLPLPAPGQAVSSADTDPFADADPEYGPLPPYTTQPVQGLPLPQLTAKNAVDEFWRHPGKAIPFLGGVIEAKEAWNLYQAAKRTEQGIETPEDFLLLNDARSRAGRGRSIGNMVVSILTELPAFGVELALTGGVYTGIRKAVEKGATKIAGKAAERGALKAATAVTGTALGAAGQVGVGQAPRVAARALERAAGGEKAVESIVKGFGDQFVETFTERTGGALAPILKKLPGATRAAMYKEAIGRYLRLRPGAKIDDVFTKIAEKTAFNGILGEMAEERLGEALRPALGLGPYEAPSGKQLAAEAVAFGVPGAAAGGARRLLGISPGATERAPTAPVVPPAVRPPPETPQEQRQQELEGQIKRTPEELRTYLRQDFGLTEEEAAEIQDENLKSTVLKLGQERALARAQAPPTPPQAVQVPEAAPAAAPPARAPQLVPAAPQPPVAPSAPVPPPSGPIRPTGISIGQPPVEAEVPAAPPARLPVIEIPTAEKLNVMGHQKLRRLGAGLGIPMVKKMDRKPLLAAIEAKRAEAEVEPTPDPALAEVAAPVPAAEPPSGIVTGAGGPLSPGEAAVQEPIRISIAGAKYDFVKENGDGTITVKNDQGNEFSTEPGEKWRIVEETASMRGKGIAPNETRDLFIKRNLADLESARIEGVRQIEKKIEAQYLKDGIKLPVGIYPSQHLLTQKRVSPVLKKLASDLRLAKSYLGRGVRNNVLTFGRAYDALKSSETAAQKQKAEATAKRIEVEAASIAEGFARFKEDSLKGKLRLADQGEKEKHLKGADHELTYERYVMAVRATEGWQYDMDKFSRDMHRDHVQRAIVEGKPVPPEVLADYPELAAKVPTTAPAAEPQVRPAAAPAPAPAPPPAPPTMPTLEEVETMMGPELRKLAKELKVKPSGASNAATRKAIGAEIEALAAAQAVPVAAEPFEAVEPAPQPKVMPDEPTAPLPGAVAGAGGPPSTVEAAAQEQFRKEKPSFKPEKIKPMSVQNIIGEYTKKHGPIRVSPKILKGEMREVVDYFGKGLASKYFRKTDDPKAGRLGLGNFAERLQEEGLLQFEGKPDEIEGAEFLAAVFGGGRSKADVLASNLGEEQPEAEAAYAKVTLAQAERLGENLSLEDYMRLKESATGVAPGEIKVDVADLPDGTKVKLQGHSFTAESHEATGKVLLRDDLNVLVNVEGTLTLDEPPILPKKPTEKTLFEQRQVQAPGQPKETLAGQSQLFKPKPGDIPTVTEVESRKKPEAPPAGAVPIPGLVEPTAPEPKLSPRQRQRLARQTDKEAVAGKEPWEMTRGEYLGSGQRLYKGVPKTDWRTGKPLADIDATKIGKKFAGYFTSSKEVADGFTEALTLPGMSHTVEATVAFKNPLIVDAGGKPAREFMTDALDEKNNNASLIAEAASGNHDGIIIKNTADEGDVHIPAKGEQIRSSVAHRAAVESALAEGKPVPPEVLADYPELAAKAKPAAPEQPRAAKPTVRKDIDQILESFKEAMIDAKNIDAFERSYNLPRIQRALSSNEYFVTGAKNIKASKGKDFRINVDADITGFFPALGNTMAGKLKLRSPDVTVIWQKRSVGKPAAPVEPPVGEPAAPVSKAKKLPDDLKKAVPRYGYGDKNFTLKFKSDVDRAAYIIAAPSKSKAHDRYLKWLFDRGGMSEIQAKAHGAEVRSAIKIMAAQSEKAGELTIEEVPAGAVPIPGLTVGPTSKTAQALVKSLGESRSKALKRLKERKRSRPLFAGIPNIKTVRIALDDLADLARIGASYIAEGAVRFADWSVLMVRDFGGKIRPHLPLIWDESQKVFIKAAEKAGVYGRPDLANPAMTKEGRELVSAMDEARNIAGQPEKESYKTMMLEADDALTNDYAGEKKRIAALIDSGAMLGPNDMAVAMKLAGREADSAIASGDVGRIAEAVKFLNGYRNLRSDVARELGVVRDPKESPLERYRRALREAILAPSDAIALKLRKALDRGNVDEANRLYRKAAEDMREVEKKLAQNYGIDLKGLLAESQVDVEAVVGESEKEISGLLEKTRGLRLPELRAMAERRMARLGLLKQELVVAHGDRKKVDAIIAAHDEEIAAMNEELSKTTYRKLTDEIASSRKRVDAMEAKLLAGQDLDTQEIIRQTLDQMRAIQDGLAREIKEQGGISETAIKTAETRIEKLTAKLEEMLAHPEQRAELQAQREKVEKLKKESKSMTAAIKRVKNEAGRLNRAIETLAKKLAAGKDKLASAARKTGDRARVLMTIRAVKEIRGSSMSDAAFEWYVNSILSGPRTQGINFFSGAVHGGWEFTIQRWAEILTNQIVRAPHAAQFVELKHLYGGFLRGFGQAARNAILAWKYEMPIIETEAGIGEAASTRLDTLTRPGIKGLKGRIIRTIAFRPMRAADEFIVSLAAHMEVTARAYRIAKAEKLTGQALTSRITELTSDMDSQAWMDAIASAQEVAFHTELGMVGKKIQHAVRNIPGVRWIVPFIRTPINIAKTGLRKTPFGTLNIAKRIAQKGFVDTRFDEYGRTYTAAEFNRHAAEQVLAYAGTIVLMGMLSGGDEDEPPRITGTVPWRSVRAAERNLKYRVMDPQSIRIGGKTVSYARIEPFATMFATTVDSINILRDAKTTGQWNDVFGKAVDSMLDQVKSKTFLRGIADVLEAIENEEHLKEWVARFGTGFVPNLIRQTAGATDPFIRETRTESLGAETRYRIFPAASNAPEPKVDLWGRDITKSGDPDGRFAVSDFLLRLPGIDIRDLPTKDELPTRLDLMILKYRQAHPDRPEAFNGMDQPQSHIRRDNKTIKLTTEQYHELAKKSGENALKILARARLNFENPDEKDMKRVSDALIKGRADARDKIVRHLPRQKPPAPRGPSR
jgi:hypothetical protein